MSANNLDFTGPPRIGTPTILDLDDATHPPMFVAEGPVELWFLNVPTRHILSMLKIPTLGKATKDPALAELARRGIEPPESLR